MVTQTTDPCDSDYSPSSDDGEAVRAVSAMMARPMVPVLVTLAALLGLVTTLAQPKSFTDDPFIDDEKFTEKGEETGDSFIVASSLDMLMTIATLIVLIGQPPWSLQLLSPWTICNMRITLFLIQGSLIPDHPS